MSEGLLEKSFHQALAETLVEVSATYVGAPQKVLEIGCHQGRVTKLLRERYTGVSILPTDKYEPQDPPEGFVCMDGENLTLEGEFDWIVSGGTFQWFEHLRESVDQFKAHLVEGGVLSFSFFLEGSMMPLAQAMSHMGYSDRLLEMRPFEELEHLLQESGYEMLCLKRCMGEDTFEDLKTMLKYLKQIGARSFGQTGSFLARDYRRLVEDMKANSDGRLPLKWDAAVVVLRKV